MVVLNVFTSAAVFAFFPMVSAVKSSLVGVSYVVLRVAANTFKPMSVFVKLNGEAMIFNGCLVFEDTFKPVRAFIVSELEKMGVAIEISVFVKSYVNGGKLRLETAFARMPVQEYAGVNVYSQITA